MKKHWSHRCKFGRVLKIYGGLLLTFAGISILYFLLSKPTVSLHKKSKKMDINNYVFDEFKQPLEKELPFEGEKIVHLDLKGAPLKVSYYAKLFPLISKLGATGILLEYEDMFPYNGHILKNISAHNAYTLKEISTINTLAKNSKLKVIPLVQTFGHMEFILKLSDFIEYREVPAYPQVICPTHKNTINILSDMIDQIMLAHPESEMIHIGADEVYYLGVCDRCSSTMSQYNLSKNMLFLEHINAVIDYIRKKYPNLQILMWDDEFRSISQKELRKVHIGKKVQPVVWKYTKDVYDELGPSLWDLYADVFPKLWIASAFKGATGSNNFVTDVTHYLQNHRSWLSIVSEYKTRINFQGIIITGWQRYDHFAVLCELLPVGLPSLAMNLRLLLGFNDSPLSPPTEVARILGCEQPYALIGSAFGSPKCSYPGGNILEYVLHLQQLKQEYDTILDDSRVRGWLSEYNIAHSYSNPQYVEAVTSPLSRIRTELMQLDYDITVAMYEIYDNYTIDEWRETYIKPFERQVNVLWEGKDSILSKDSWPRRPLLEGDSKNEL